MTGTQSRTVQTHRVDNKIAITLIYSFWTGFPHVLESYGKSWNLKKEFSRPGKSWKMTVVMERHGKVMEFHQ